MLSRSLSSSMAIARAHGAMSSSVSKCNYHVFLSFRGEDTRKNFTDHLYNALVEAGFRTFRDDDEIDRGEEIANEIRKAIRESRVLIVVLSKNYASSRWCLDELVMLLGQRRIMGHILIPVFYKVDPSDVRKQAGRYGEAFAKHEERFKNEMTMVMGWRAALREVSDLKGMVLLDGYEVQFVKDIVENVSKVTYRTPLYVCPYLVGIESRIRDINFWLQDRSDCANIALIFGIGGVGKTTIAKTVYNQNFNKFERSCFVVNVRETSAQPNGLVCLQRKLLSDIQKGRSSKSRGVDEGILKIRDAICHKRVLIVLDDVDQFEQLYAVIGMEDFPNSGSKIIVTARNECVLRAHISCVKIRVEPLDDDASLQLFSWHAFGHAYPLNECMKLCKTAIRHCGGLPLALEVLGSCLSSLSINLWGRALREPEEIDDGKVHKVLRISYDSLQDDRDKNLFLDVACFFIGKDKDYVDKVLEDCDMYTVVGLQRLIERCLVAISENNQLIMHQLIRDMAREIVRQESENPGERTRLWRHRDAHSVLRKNNGTKNIRSFILDQELANTALTSKVDLKTEAFEKMSNLKLLHLNNVDLLGEYHDFPSSLVWLCWRGFSLNWLPINISLGDLVVLDMRHSSLQHFCVGTQSLINLKILNLSHSHLLVSVPVFNGLPNLERLILKNCSSLVEIDESIGVLERLVCLNLKDCSNLRTLPKEIARLKSLQTLVLAGCSGLYLWPYEQSNLSHSASTSTRELVILPPRKRLRTSRFLFSSLPRFLVHLSLTNCNLSDVDIPEDLSMLSLLQELDLGHNHILTLPESICNLTSLRSLSLYQCKKLQCLPELPVGLKYVNVSGCISLERIRSLKSFTFLKFFMLYGCENLVEIGGVFKLQTPQTGDMEMIKKLRLFDLGSLGRFELKMVSAITDKIRKTSLVQVMCECGICSFYVLGNEIPYWYNYQNDGSSLSFDVPHSQGPAIVGINLCVVYTACGIVETDAQDYFEALGSPFVAIENSTKGLTWFYFPTSYAMEDAENKLWLSHWNSRDLLEPGDHMIVRIGTYHTIQVKKVGICLVSEQEVEGSQSVITAMAAGTTLLDCKEPASSFIPHNQLSYCPLLRFSSHLLQN